MKVASILKVKGTTVETTPPRTSIATSARLLRDKHIGALVVSEDGTGVLGIITERDIVHGLADRGPALLDLPGRGVGGRRPPLPSAVTGAARQRRAARSHGSGVLSPADSRLWRSHGPHAERNPRRDVAARTRLPRLPGGGAGRSPARRLRPR